MVQFGGDKTGLSEKQLEYIASVLKKEGFEDAKVTLESVGEVGDNYVATMKRIIAEKDGRTFRMVAKVAPTEGRTITPVSTNKLFFNEYYMYSTVLPKFTSMEKAAGIPANERLRYAKFYGALLEEPFEIILLEDLQVPGFALLSRFQSLPNEAIELVLESLAKIHACSYALRSQEPDIFNEFKQALGDDLFQMAKDENAMLLFNSFTGDAEAVLRSDKHKAVLQKHRGKMAEYIRDLHDTEFDSRYSVIQQGDCWSNNIMFRLEGTTPAECCMIDYQVSRVNSPASDLLYMIFSCTDYDGRSKHFHYWMDYYHYELDKNLNRFGLNSNYLYPRERLAADLKKQGKLALFNALMFAGATIRESADAVKMKEALKSFGGDKKDFEKALQAANLATADEVTAAKYRTRVTEAIDSFLELGYI